MSFLELKNVMYAYDKGNMVLRGVNAQLEEGKMYAILGPSGCGKTTLLSLLGGLDSPTKGAILYQGENIEETGLARHRAAHVAFIFQSYNLIDYLTPLENVALTSKLSPQPILMRVGLTKEESRRNVQKLSGGQQQRVAIARALASDAKLILADEPTGNLAKLILADEPTGNLDEETAAEIIGILKSSARASGKCVVVVTHARELADQADVVYQLTHGRL